MAKYRYDFEEIKRTIPVLTALEMLGVDTSNAKHVGKEISLSCPFEGCEGRSSFKTSSEKNLWRCFKCERGGDVLRLIELLTEVSTFQAAKRLAEHAGMQANQAGKNGRTEAEEVSNLDWVEGESTDDLIRYLREAGELDRLWAVVYELVRRRRSRGQPEEVT